MSTTTAKARTRKPKAAPPPPRDPVGDMPALGLTPEILGTPVDTAQSISTQHVEVAIANIEPDPRNVRSVADDHAADAGLRASIALVGILEPPTVRAHPDKPGTFMVVMGHRRIAAAKAIGRATVRCLLLDRAADDSAIAAMQAAENMVRAPMHPVDRWKAVQRMIDGGMTDREAFASVGLSPREGALLRRLAAIHPHVLAVLAAIPTSRFVGVSRHLHVISTADHGAQLSALAKMNKTTLADPERTIQSLAGVLQRPVISAEAAIFPIKDSRLPWIEDLFAQPTDPERWTTTDVKGFVREQKAALEAAARDEAAAGYPVRVVAFDEGAQEPVIPNGWVKTWHPAEGPLPKGSRSIIFTWVKTSGYGVGKVERVRCDPKAEREAKGGEKAERAVRGPITKKGLDRVAHGQELAIQAAVDEIADPAQMVTALMIALGAGNIRIDGGPHNYEPPLGYAAGRFSDLSLAVAKVAAEGRHDDAAAVAMEHARTALKRLIAAPTPLRWNTSGPPALHLGKFLDAARHLPRFDTMEFLAEVNAATLAALCGTYGQNTGKTGAMRSALAGRMEHWMPDGSDFKGPAPDVLAVGVFGGEAAPEGEPEGMGGEPGHEPGDDYVGVAGT